jgi:lycopene beta-cyclase
MSEKSIADLVIVGSTLTGCLTALKFRFSHPSLRILLIETGEDLGPNATWTFFETDVTPEALNWLKALTSRSWTEEKIHFSKFDRVISKQMFAIRSEDLHKAVKAALEDGLMLEAKVVKVSENFVVMNGGEVIEGKCLLDARNLDHLPPAGINGFHKSVGYDVKVEVPHGLTSALVMDADCPQLDGFRYFQILPWGDLRLFVREGYFSASNGLNFDRISRSVQSLVERQGFKVASIERQESSVVALPFTGGAMNLPTGTDLIHIGVRGGFFNSATGNVLPDAVRVAEHLAALPELSTAKARESLMRFRKPVTSRQRFYRLLNRLVFFGSEPMQSHLLFRHLCELPSDTFERFCAGRSTWSDRLRILWRKPPVRFNRAIRNWTEQSVLERFTVDGQEQPMELPQFKQR